MTKQPRESASEEEVLLLLESAILHAAEGKARLQRELPVLIRRSIDEVIDAPRTGRLTLSETEKTEKTYLGTKIEILLRCFLGFPKGQRLDLNIQNIEVDIKNTMGNTWMIPTEALDHPCLLIQENESTARYSFGIFIARKDNLTKGQNKDSKFSVSAAGKEHTRWICKDELYPRNFWEDVPQKLIAEIRAKRSGKARLDVLFRNMQDVPVPRSVVLAIAQQKDAMKRLRKNGGARDSLALDGIALLSGNYDAEIIKALGLPSCEKDQFISYTPKSDAEKKLLLPV